MDNDVPALDDRSVPSGDSLEIERIVLFVHGFTSDASIWDPMMRLIAGDADLSKMTVEAFRYHTKLFRWNPLRVIPDLDVLADQLRTRIELLVDQGAAVALVGHSQGGLVIQRYLSRVLARGEATKLAAVRRIVLFACPNSGSGLALNTRKFILRSRNAQEQQLRPFNAAVHEAHEAVISRIIYVTASSDTTHPIDIRVFAGAEDGVVPIASARGTFPNVRVLPGDHNTIIQPDDTNDVRYLALKRSLLEGAAAAGSAATPAASGYSAPVHDTTPDQSGIIQDDDSADMSFREQVAEAQARQASDERLAFESLSNAPTAEALMKLLSSLISQRVVSQRGLRVRLIGPMVAIYLRLKPLANGVLATFERRMASRWATWSGGTARPP